ncbi:MAG TPA: DHHA1 domain-containing protein, partial [Candidatus Nitrosocosmicus sp.]|nr:DHHA1 domain-containing protein [Candidatus Nitrosocosmicus sp.]
LLNSKKERILSITHQQDIDGLFCGAILKNAFPDTLVYLTNYGYRNILNIANTIETNITKSKKQGTIIISDLSVDNTEEASIIKSAGIKATARGWNFFWIDHHAWRPEVKDMIKSFATVVLSEEKDKKCASELICDIFDIKRTACTRMAKFAHIADFRLPELSNMPPLPEMVRYYSTFSDHYRKLQSIINKASSGIFWDNELQAEYESKYLPQKDLAIKEALKSLMVTSIHEYKVAVIEAPKILSKGILSELVYNLYDDVDIVILFSPDGKISIRRKPDSEIRCDLIAQKLNGGGHSYAAAGIIKSPIYLENSKTRTINVQDVIRALQVVLA